MSDSTFKINTNQQPNPGKTIGGSDQPSGMKSDSQLHKEAKDEDMGKC